MGGGGLGIGAIVVIFAISYFTGISPQVLMSGAEMVATGSSTARRAVERARLIPTTRRAIFSPMCSARPKPCGRKSCRRKRACATTPTTMVPLYRRPPASGCGGARAAMGPFYCPADKKIYLDISFFQEMQEKYGGGGDFAYAYVIAHEVGHHVEDLFGILDRVDAAEQGVEPVRRP